MIWIWKVPFLIVLIKYQPEKIRSQDFLNLLNVELSIGGDSWENQLQPALKFVQDIQEESTYLDWLKYFARCFSLLLINKVRLEVGASH